MEWDDNLAQMARTIAADVIAQSGLELHREEIMSGEWDGDDNVIIAMRALMKMEPAIRNALGLLDTPIARRHFGSPNPADSNFYTAVVASLHEALT